MATDPTSDSKPPAANEPSAMAPYAIEVALFAAFMGRAPAKLISIS